MNDMQLVGAVDLVILIGGILALGINQFRIDRRNRK